MAGQGHEHVLEAGLAHLEPSALRPLLVASVEATALTRSPAPGAVTRVAATGHVHLGQVEQHVVIKGGGRAETGPALAAEALRPACPVCRRPLPVQRR